MHGKYYSQKWPDINFHLQCQYPRKRQWTVYIYPHSHVDIGYTNTQENVELIHKRNLLYGIDLARKTAGYPEGCTIFMES